MSKLGLVIIFSLFAFVSKAQMPDYQNYTDFKEGKSVSLFKESFLIVGYQNLRSTHIDHFAGFDMMVGHNFTPRFSLGIGVEDIFGHHHYDNGWSLSDIRLVPVKFDARYLFFEDRFVVPFVELSTGITFLKYYKKLQVPAGSPDVTEVDGVYYYGRPFLVKENGLYTYLGTGAYFRIGKHFMPFIGIGFKGYKMSMNVLDVNPRGLNFDIGCKF